MRYYAENFGIFFGILALAAITFAADTFGWAGFLLAISWAADVLRGLVG